MPNSTLCSIEIFADRPRGRRGAAFLVFEGNNNVNAQKRFRGLNKIVQFTFKKTIEDWTDGIESKNQLCSYRRLNAEGKHNCVVFEYQHHRLYGFLSIPRGRYQLCIFATYLPQRQWDMEETILQRCEQLRTSLDVRRAINKSFKENKT